MTLTVQRPGARKLDIPDQYKDRYNKGWAISNRDANLESLDRAGAGEEAYDGYLDNASGREKWHMYHCRLNGGCEEHVGMRPLPSMVKQSHGFAQLFTGYSDIMAPQHNAHGFAQTDTVKHCPFCGSGDVWGGSDGTITCEFDGATFQVSVEPQYPSAPGNIAGQPLDIDGQPDEMGQAGAGDAMAVPEGMSPSSGESLGAGEEGQEGEPVDEDDEVDEEGGGGGGPPWAQGQGDEEDEDEEGGPPANFPPKKSYLTFMGDHLAEGDYLKHLAIRHAEEPRQFLASLRSTAEVINRACPDWSAHNKDAEMATWAMFPHTGDGLRRMYQVSANRAQEDYEACDGTAWAHHPNFEEAYQDFKHRQQHEGLAG